MYLLAKSFNFNGKELPEKYILASPDEADMQRESTISRTTSYGNLTSYRPIPHYYSSTYSEVLKFDVFLLKEDRKLLSQSEMDDLILWLDAPNDHCLFTITDYEGVSFHKGLEYFALPIGYNEFGVDNMTYGLIFHFECNAPFPFTRDHTYPFDSKNTVTIDNTSHETSDDIYPTIELTSNFTGEVSIKNTVYPEEIVKLNVLEGQKLTIDNLSGDITDNLNLFDYSKDTNLNWLHLAPGKNSITFTGNVSGTIKCKYVRKVGI